MKNGDFFFQKFGQFKKKQYFCTRNVGKVSKMVLKHVGKVTKIGAKRIGKVTYDRQKHRQNH